MDVNGQLHAPAALAPGIYWIGDWVGPRAGPDTVVKRKKNPFPSPARNGTQVAKPVA
jgi:hypothetical protein